MTDRAQPKAKKEKAVKEPKAKKAGPKLVVADLKGIGHNSGEVIPGLVKIVEELLFLNDQKKTIGISERTLRNRAKAEFGVLSGALAHEMRLRKMDRDVREQFESAHKDLKVALGYQTELDFLKAGEKAQIDTDHSHQPGFMAEPEAANVNNEAPRGVISREG